MIQLELTVLMLSSGAGPKMVAVRNYHGTPAPPGKPPLSLQTGDFVELLKGEPDTAWWEVRSPPPPPPPKPIGHTPIGLKTHPPAR